MDIKEIIHIFENSRLVSEDFTSEGVTVAYVEALSALQKQLPISREIKEGKYFCPICHNLMSYPGYCGCGQKVY